MQNFGVRNVTQSVNCKLVKFLDRWVAHISQSDLRPWQADASFQNPVGMVTKPGWSNQ